MDLVNEKAYIFGGLFVLANRIQILGDRVDPDVSIKQWLFIAVVSKFKDTIPTLTEISAVMGSSHQNVKKMAVILENRGFIKLYRDEKDTRAIKVIRTDKCEKHFNAMEKKEIEFIGDLFAGFSEQQIHELYFGIRSMTDNVTEMENRHENTKKE